MYINTCVHKGKARNKFFFLIFQKYISTWADGSAVGLQMWAYPYSPPHLGGCGSLQIKSVKLRGKDPFLQDIEEFISGHKPCK